MIDENTIRVYVMPALFTWLGFLVSYGAYNPYAPTQIPHEYAYLFSLSGVAMIVSGISWFMAEKDKVAYKHAYKEVTNNE